MCCRYNNNVSYINIFRYIFDVMWCCVVWCAVGRGGSLSTEDIVQIALLVVVTGLLITLILTLAVCYLRLTHG